MSMNITLDPDTFREATAQAIVSGLTDEIKQGLIRSAIKYILSPDDVIYGRKETPLQYAFNQAVLICAERITREMVDKDPVLNEKIRELIGAAITKATSVDNDKLAGKMAAAFVDCMRVRD